MVEINDKGNLSGKNKPFWLFSTMTHKLIVGFAGIYILCDEVPYNG